MCVNSPGLLAFDCSFCESAMKINLHTAARELEKGHKYFRGKHLDVLGCEYIF